MLSFIVMETRLSFYNVKTSWFTISEINFFFFFRLIFIKLGYDIEPPVIMIMTLNELLSLKILHLPNTK